MKFQLLFISLLVACASSLTVELAANEQTDLSVSALFGADLATAISSLSYTNGNASANVTFTQIVTASASLSALIANTTNFNAIFNVALGGKIGFSLTSNVTGGGQLTFVVSNTFPGSLNNSVLLSTPFASGQANSVVYVPSATVAGSSQISFSLAFNRNYTFAVLADTTSVGYTLATAYQAVFGTLSNVANRAYLQFSATQNAFSQTAAEGSTQTGNAYVQLFNRLGDATQLTVSTKTYASGAVVAPNGTVNNVGVQFSIVATSSNFNGDLTYVSNGATVNGKGTATFSWYKAASNTASANGWTKVASTSNVDANGNLVVTTTVSGSFSEWAVASDNSATSTSTSSTSASSYSVSLSSTTNSASSVAIGSLALIGAVALAF